MSQTAQQKKLLKMKTKREVAKRQLLKNLSLEHCDVLQASLYATSFETAFEAMSDMKH